MERSKKWYKVVQFVTEPLIPPEMPERSFQKAGVDLFKFNEKTYLLIVDYFSRFPTVSSTTSLNVINHLKSTFAQHGISHNLRSVSLNSIILPRVINHVTSSPRFAHSNAEVELVLA